MHRSNAVALKASNVVKLTGDKSTYQNKWVTSHTRIDYLTPIVWREIIEKFSDSDYFIREQLMYTECLRQFSPGYRISLISKIVKTFLEEKKLIKLTYTDLAIWTPERAKGTKARNKETAFSMRYVTTAADELINGIDFNRKFTGEWLANWLYCLDHLAESSRYVYANRIIKDLIMRDVIIHVGDFKYSLNKK